MRLATIAIGLAFLAQGVQAETAGVPAGCILKATILRPNCEMHQILTCENDPRTRVDVYSGGVFRGEEAYLGTGMLRWRRGNLLQELIVTSGDFADVPLLPEGRVLTVVADRSRKQLGTDGAPMLESFTYEIEVDGPAVRPLASGQTREIRRYHVISRSSGHEALDVRIDYDPALGVPIWTEGEVTAPDGQERSVTQGTAAVMFPGDEGFAQVEPPAGAACSAG